MPHKNAIQLMLVLFWAQEAALAALLFAWGHPWIGGFLAVVSALVALHLVASAYALFFGAPYVAMEKDRVAKVLAMVDLKAGEKLVDLGSGDGRILIAAAGAGARAEGWEVNPYLWAYSAWKIWRLGLGGRARVHLGSYWPASFNDADAVTLFLVTDQMPRMEEKLRKELKSGARVVSFVFPFPDWSAEKQAENTFLYRR